MTNTLPSIQNHIVLDETSEYTLHDISFSSLPLETQKRTKRFIDVTIINSNSIRIKKAKNHIVGTFSVGPYKISLPPPINPDAFVKLLIYAYDGDLSKFEKNELHHVNFQKEDSTLFIKLLASIMVSQAEALLNGHLSKSYVRQDILTKTLRGKINWSRSFGRMISDGVFCHVFQQTHDDLLNRIILAGLQSAEQHLAKTGTSSDASTQVNIWRQLTSGRLLTEHDFTIADQKINRLTESYRPAILIAKALTNGLTARDLINPGATPLNHLEFSMPFLFECFLIRLIKPFVQNLGMRIEFKTRDRHALLDGAGSNYREVEPDIVIFKGKKPVGVIDAKFKPGYVTPSQSNPLSPVMKVSNADIYQILFYQSQLHKKNKLTNLPCALIIAPTLTNIEPHSISIENRTIIWPDPDTTSPPPYIKVLPISIGSVINALQHHPESDVINSHMPELAIELEKMAI